MALNIVSRHQLPNGTWVNNWHGVSTDALPLDSDVDRLAIGSTVFQKDTRNVYRWDGADGGWVLVPVDVAAELRTLEVLERIAQSLAVNNKLLGLAFGIDPEGLI